MQVVALQASCLRSSIGLLKEKNCLKKDKFVLYPLPLLKQGKNEASEPSRRRSSNTADRAQTFSRIIGLFQFRKFFQVILARLKDQIDRRSHECYIEEAKAKLGPTAAKNNKYGLRVALV